jgi:hypothetical protein
MQSPSWSKDSGGVSHSHIHHWNCYCSVPHWAVCSILRGLQRMVGFTRVFAVLFCLCSYVHILFRNCLYWENGLLLRSHETVVVLLQQIFCCQEETNVQNPSYEWMFYDILNCSWTSWPECGLNTNWTLYWNVCDWTIT